MFLTLAVVNSTEEAKDLDIAFKGIELYEFERQ
jgi:hypothetical protein